MSRARWWLALLVAAAAIFTRPAGAQTSAPPKPGVPPESGVDEARALADRGYELFTQGDYAEAIALFEQAEKLSHSPVILSFIAQSYELLAKLIEARNYYARIVAEQLGEDSPEDFIKAQRRARRQVPLLERRIPRLLLRVTGAPGERISIFLDGVPLTPTPPGKTMEVNPGRRALRFEREGLPPVIRAFTATERQIAEIDVVFATKRVEVPVVPKDPVPRWLLPASLFAVSFAGSAVSLVTMGVYFDRAADLKSRCPENRCPPELEGERDTISAIGIASMVSFGIGAAAAGAGTLLIFYGPDRRTSVSIAPFGIRGSF
ncbi:MAG TPA: tetratricopeptide repeat protein [Polyangiaceae bacterium]|jgi:hypothetical protein|nr:tetratricopeptide repeat protein [Polyangiaceae bacterium]